jgi:hypothetical protein
MYMGEDKYRTQQQTLVLYQQVAPPEQQQQQGEQEAQELCQLPQEVRRLFEHSYGNVVHGDDIVVNSRKVPQFVTSLRSMTASRRCASSSIRSLTFSVAKFFRTCQRTRM